MANDSLFLALANAKSQPDKWARAVGAGAQAGNDILGGYLKGKEVKQQLDQYKLLSTPLGTMYSDPSQIPFGLSPQHTVKDLLTIAPAMENFAPANLMSGVAQQYGANVNTPSPQSDTASTQAPAPTIASTSMAPIPGSENPTPRPGVTNLNSDEGTGAGGGSNIAPGASPTIPSSPGLNIPPGGMGMGAFQKVVIPALNAAREGRQFQQGQAQTAALHADTEAQNNARQRNQINAENNRTMAGATKDISSSLTSAGTIQDDLNALKPLFLGQTGNSPYKPIPFLGGVGANIAARSGSSTFGNQTMQTGKAIDQITPALSAKVNYLLNKRFNAGEANMLAEKVVPNSTDDDGNFIQKTGNLNRLVAVMQSGDINQLRMIASSIAGQPVNPVLPSSTTAPVQAPQNSTNSTGGQGPRIRVRSRQTGQTGTVSFSNFDPNKYEKI